MTIHEEVEKFRYRMKGIIKHVTEESEKIEKKEEQTGLVAGLKGLVEVMTTKENKSMKLVKVAKAPGWIRNMDLKTYIKTLQVWMEQNKDVNKNEKYHEVMESLKMNKEIVGLSDYVVTYILPELDTVENKKVEEIVSKLQKRYGKTRLEEVEEIMENGHNLKEVNMKRRKSSCLKWKGYIRRKKRIK